MKTTKFKKVSELLYTIILIHKVHRKDVNKYIITFKKHSLCIELANRYPQRESNHSHNHLIFTYTEVKQKPPITVAFDCPRGSVREMVIMYNGRVTVRSLPELFLFCIYRISV